MWHKNDERNDKMIPKATFKPKKRNEHHKKKGTLKISEGKSEKTRVKYEKADIVCTSCRIEKINIKGK